MRECVVIVIVIVMMKEGHSQVITSQNQLPVFYGSSVCSWAANAPTIVYNQFVSSEETNVNAAADRGSVQPHTRVMRTGFFPGLFLPLASWAINFNWDGDWLSCISERKKHGDKRKYEIDGRENPSFRFSIDKKTGLATLDCSYGNPNPSRTGQIHHNNRRNRQPTLHSRIRHRDMRNNTDSVVRHLHPQHPGHRMYTPS